MNTQPQPHSHKETDRPLLAIISVLLSSLGGLMLVLILGLSLFGFTIFSDLMCFLAHRVDENGTTLILFVPIYLPLLLALIFSFIARWSSGTSRVVEGSHILALGLFVLTVALLRFLLFPIYLPLLLALIIFAFVARRSSGTSRVVEGSHILALGLFVLAVALLRFLLFLTTACYG